ncbi:membrane protein insertion efficiency factor YidD [Candidatus Roizmanbacteria bacterium]|nr:membrane protein insertion efficiency factor YidD [Candidatus Roizmanbacteria bacterium]
MKYTLLLLIRLYQFLSPTYAALTTALFGIKPGCRFSPSCSEYSYTAIEKYGAIKGGKMSLERIANCNPTHAGGYDPVV